MLIDRLLHQASGNIAFVEHMLQVNHAAMHAHCQIRARRAHEHNHAAGHVFAQEAAGVSANHDSWRLVAILLHVNADAPTAAVAHQNAAAAHAVARSIAHAPMNHNVAVVHGVGDLILSIAEDLDFAAVHVARHVVARHAMNLEALARGHTAPKIALGECFAQFHHIGVFESRTHCGVALGEVHRAERDHRFAIKLFDNGLGRGKVSEFCHVIPRLLPWANQAR